MVIPVGYFHIKKSAEGEGVGGHCNEIREKVGGWVCSYHKIQKLGQNPRKQSKICHSPYKTK